MNFKNLGCEEWIFYVVQIGDKLENELRKVGHVRVQNFHARTASTIK